MTKKSEESMARLKAIMKKRLTLELYLTSLENPDITSTEELMKIMKSSPRWQKAETERKEVITQTLKTLRSKAEAPLDENLADEIEESPTTSSEGVS